MGDGEHDILFVLPWLSNLDVLDTYNPVAEALESVTRVGRVILFDRGSRRVDPRVTKTFGWCDTGRTRTT